MPWIALIAAVGVGLAIGLSAPTAFKEARGIETSWTAALRSDLRSGAYGEAFWRLLLPFVLMIVSAWWAIGGVAVVLAVGFWLTGR